HLARYRHAADGEERQEDGERDDQPNRREADRRQVTQPELDEQPDAAPNQAGDPPEEEGHVPVLGAGCWVLGALVLGALVLGALVLGALVLGALVPGCSVLTGALAHQRLSTEHLSTEHGT